MVFGPFVDIQGVCKSFGSTRALRGVSLGLGRGEVHGLLGENGAGKSTLMKVLSGVVVPDSGTAVVDGVELGFWDAGRCKRAGVAIAFQELSSPSNVSVATKLCWPGLPRGRLGLVSRRAMLERASDVFERFGVRGIDPLALIGDLSLAQRQQVEIVAAMACDPKLLILDEPTAALPDTDWLFARIRELSARGVTVIYISHKMSEIESICASGTVLRNGSVVGSFSRGSCSQDELVELMVGRSLAGQDGTGSERGRAVGDGCVLEVSGFDGEGRGGVDLAVHEREIVGVAGLEGQGQKELLYSIAGGGGVPRGGRVSIVQSDAASRVALVPEERKTEALFARQRTDFNVLVSVLSSVSSFGFLRGARWRGRAGELSALVNLPGEMLGRAVEDLSGGNQQKAVVARALALDPACLVLFDPTRGVDPGTKFELYGSIRRFAGRGRGVLMYSTEIPELVRLCDRVYVMRGGSVAGEFSGEGVNERSIMAAALGWKSRGLAEGEE